MSRCWSMMLALLGVLALWSGAASAQSLTLQLESQGTYAGVPFVISAVAEGFDKDPTPDIDSPQIAGCQVTPLGVSPSMSTSMSIINGRRSVSSTVTFAFRFQVVADKPGTHTIPALTVRQGQISASSSPARFEVTDISASTDMAIELNLPDRPIWIGETVPVTIDWYLSQDVSDQAFSIPLFNLEDVVRVAAAPADKNERTLTVAAGGLNLELPYTRDQVQRGRHRYTRFRLAALLTPLQAGEIAVPPSQVVARVQVGTGRDRFGFPSARVELRKSIDKARTLQVRAVPLSGRPDSFAGAVGSAESIETSANRTVVQVGEPFELTITIRGHGSLDGLKLPKLANRDQLDPTLFDLPDTEPVGTVEDGAKTFVITVRLRTNTAHEIPALDFSYFDPKDGTFHTAHSQPIALSVAGSAIVGSDAVVSAPASPSSSARLGAAAKLGEAATSAPAADPFATLTGADLALSDPAHKARPAWSSATVRLPLLLLYGCPLLLFAVLTRRRQRRGERAEARRLRQARATVREAARHAKKQPAREAAAALVAALRGLGREIGSLDAVSELVNRIEVAAYAPTAAQDPLSADLLDAALNLADQLQGARASGGFSSKAGAGAATVLLAALCLGLAGPGGPAAAAAEGAAAEGAAAEGAAAASESGDPWAIYQQALAASDRQDRLAAFARAEAGFATLVAAHPRLPDLLTDLGNAALGARHTGQAVLAFSRAVALDPAQSRARRNLDWVREQLPAGQARSENAGALGLLLFWRQWLSPPQLELLSGFIFAAIVLLFVPWSDRRWPRRLGLALIVPWLAVLASIWLANADQDDGVILESTALRAADSPGAPLVMQEPLHEGAEVDLSQQRDGWVSVQLQSGLHGWVRAAAVARVAQ